VEGVGDLGEVGVIQSRQSSRLAVKLLAGLSKSLRRGVRVWAHLLDRADAALQAEVLRAIHRAHSPLAHDRHDFIASAQDGLRFKQTSQGNLSSSSSPLMMID
jgi:hypothetical protein